MLTQGKDQASLQKIAERAAKGDTAQLKSLIQSITSTPGGAELVGDAGGCVLRGRLRLRSRRSPFSGRFPAAAQVQGLGQIHDLPHGLRIGLQRLGKNFK